MIRAPRPCLSSAPRATAIVKVAPVSARRAVLPSATMVPGAISVISCSNQTLQAFGYRVLTAADGAEAVAVYAEHKNEIAVVLTDMMMPIMDGAAVIRALRRINPNVKMIAASGLTANGSVANVSEAGIKHFLAKPYTAGTLLKVLREILDET